MERIDAACLVRREVVSEPVSGPVGTRPALSRRWVDEMVDILLSCTPTLISCVVSADGPSHGVHRRLVTYDWWWGAGWWCWYAGSVYLFDSDRRRHCNNHRPIVGVPTACAGAREPGTPTEGLPDSQSTETKESLEVVSPVYWTNTTR